jgi:hypothetical protein
LISVYHNLDYGILARMADPAERDRYQPTARDLELAALVDADDLDLALDRVIHRDGEAWTTEAGVVVFSDPSVRRTTHDGDVFVTADGAAFLVLPVGFRPLPGLRLPFLGG